MIRTLVNRFIRSFEERYGYDAGYFKDILRSDLWAFGKFMGFQAMSAHEGNIPVGPLYAARIRATLWEDCGPCAQLIVDMALEAGVKESDVKYVVEGRTEHLPSDIALVLRFTELVLAHSPQADVLRTQILERWGTRGLVAIAFGISSSRVYPTLKYSMGHGATCQAIHIQGNSLSPRFQPMVSEAPHA